MADFAEPIIALDGDTAGLRAAMRLIDLSLPLLEAGQSLRFALMPEGQDPDDVLKAKGLARCKSCWMRPCRWCSCCGNAKPKASVSTAPNAKRPWTKSLREKIKLIKDPSIRSHYGQAIKDLRWELFQHTPSHGRDSDGVGSAWQMAAPQKRCPATNHPCWQCAGDATDHLREAVILATVI